MMVRRSELRAVETIRLCLDVNVWVGHYLASVRRPGLATAASGLAQVAFLGACRLGPVQPVVSHAMLDTLEFVLRRMTVTAPIADMARDQVEAAAAGGYLAEPASIILGGSAAYALLDEEDAGVLNAAMAGHADLLVTGNLADFVRGPRAQTVTVPLAMRDGEPDAIRLNHPKHKGGLVIASPFCAASWIVRGVPPPPGIQTRFASPAGSLERFQADRKRSARSSSLFDRMIHTL